MKRIPLMGFVLIAAVCFVFGQKDRSQMTTRADEDSLKQMVHEWADAAVHADLAKLEKFAHENFRGSAEGISFNKKMLHDAIKSGQMKVARWDCNNDELKVSVRGNSASVTGRCTLSNATYMGKDFSGSWHFTDRFVKEKVEAGEPSARKQEGSSNEPLTPDLRSRQVQIGRPSIGSAQRRGWLD